MARWGDQRSHAAKHRAPATADRPSECWTAEVHHLEDHRVRVPALQGVRRRREVCTRASHPGRPYPGSGTSRTSCSAGQAHQAVAASRHAVSATGLPAEVGNRDLYRNMPDRAVPLGVDLDRPDAVDPALDLEVEGAVVASRPA